MTNHEQKNGTSRGV